MNNSSKHCISLTVINASFNNRVERTQFLVNKFGKYLTGEILDVGCDQAPLKDIVKSIKYTGIDIDGKPTIKVDLERIDRLPLWIANLKWLYAAMYLSILIIYIKYLVR